MNNISFQKKIFYMYIHLYTVYHIVKCGLGPKSNLRSRLESRNCLKEWVSWL